MQRFERRVNAGFEDLFPGVLSVAGVSYAAACSGGRTYREFDESGLPVTRKERVVRVRGELLAAAPAIGAEVRWAPEDGAEVRLRVLETPERPHGLAWSIRCEEL